MIDQYAPAAGGIPGLEYDAETKTLRFEGAFSAREAVNPYAKCVVPCADLDGRFTDISGNAADLFPDTGCATPFAAPGYITTTAAQKGGVVLTTDKFSWNPTREWLIFSFALKRAAPGANQTILSFSASAAQNANPQYWGFYLSHRISGGLKLVDMRNGTADGARPDSRLSFSDATPVDRQVTIMFDPEIGAFYLWKDGILSDSWIANKLVGANAFPDANLSYKICFGGLVGDTDVTTACAGSFRNIHIYKGPGRAPVSGGEIAQLLAQRPSEIAPVSAFVFPKKRIRLGLAVQSNGQGPGPINFNVTRGRGGPLRDIIAPNGGYNTWWPTLSSAMGKRNMWLEVSNTGYGQTGLCDWWVGRCRAFFVGMQVSSGSFVTYNGRTYRAKTATGNNLPIGDGNTNHIVTVANNPSVGGDANLTWTDLGPSLPVDTDGYVYSSADTNRWDPNGMIQNAINYNNPANNPGFDAYGIYVDLGQGDKTLLVTRSQYAKAMINIANYITAQGMYAFLGLTNSGNSAGLNAWYVSTGQPGRLDALAALAGNPLVKAGADLFAAVGVLPTETVANDPIPKLQSDLLHLNSSAMLLAARAVDVSMEAAGF